MSKSSDTLLIKRLREYRGILSAVRGGPLTDEAADRIEKLEAELFDAGAMIVELTARDRGIYADDKGEPI